MQNKPVKYLHLLPDAALPELSEAHRFKAVLAIESEGAQMWQWDVCRWLARSGCRVVMTWGNDCEAWAEAVDDASLERFDYGDIPEEEMVITTSHADDDLEEVFWFAKHRAAHPVLNPKDILVIHIADMEKRREFDERFADA